MVPPGLCQLVSFLGSGAVGSVSWLSVLPVWVQDELSRILVGVCLALGEAFLHDFWF